MPTLNPGQRDQLATVIGKENADGGARVVAAAGAQAAIEALAVHLPAPYSHLDAAGKQLRNHLRARARQLGDARHADGRHEIGRLVEQAAYEHWHRMLFARFLAENELLIHPQMNVAVTLQECEELAPSEGAADAWELAGRYASRMLPQIFRPDDPVLAVDLAAEHQRELERLLASLPPELFRASDSLGWCYQFWQARKKKEVNASEVKIGADELPAVTQLFTEPYMVQFLLHNTLGAWWVGAGRTLPVEMPYLRLLDDDNGTPAAGTFDGWPRLARELKVLDPCCGSGHFLVAAFEILVAFRMAEEGLTAREACDAVLRDNLFGLEIDFRCVQIAAFALAMAAWTYPDAGGYRPLASMNVACSGLAISAKKEEWERLGGDNSRLRAGMGYMWELFSDAPVLGSLIDPVRGAPDSLYAASPVEVRPFVERALSNEDLELDAREDAVVARGTAEAAALLNGRFALVATNVPYLLRRKQDPKLLDYVKRVHPDGVNDLAIAFLDRIGQLLASGGTSATVVPQSVIEIRSYQSFRRRTLDVMTWNFVGRLGPGAFQTIGGEVVNVCLLAMSASVPDKDAAIVSLDVTGASNTQDKDLGLRTAPITVTKQATIRAAPESRFSTLATRGALLGEVAAASWGISPADLPRFGRQFWEIADVDGIWRRWQSSFQEPAPFAGRNLILNMGPALDAAVAAGSALIRGSEFWGKKSVVATVMGSIPCTLGTGEPVDTNVATIVPKNPAHLPALWAFCRSGEFSKSVRKLYSGLKVTSGTLTQVPFDLAYWSEVAEREGVEFPNPDSDDPTQWAFKGAPRAASSPLQVAVARLLGYHWPDQQPDAVDAHADSDGIVCIPALRGERTAAARLRDLLAAAWGKDPAGSGWHPQVLTDLLTAVGHRGDLEDWLRDAFFRQHCELFHHRPFIWHIWDGHREGFSALVNYHKLDHEGLKSLTYTYLGDWIRTQEIQAAAGESGAGDRLAKARALQQRLAAILEGEAPYDIFVRWKPIEQQPIGWRPDLDDGVRLNIRPFMTGSPMRTDGPKAGQGAGVLRYKPNIKWGKDRGKNPPGSPWGEIRDNATHLTLAEKRAARGE